MPNSQIVVKMSAEAADMAAETLSTRIEVCDAAIGILKGDDIADPDLETAAQSLADAASENEPEDDNCRQAGLESINRIRTLLIEARDALASV
jgi:hypothetical protein